MEKENAKKTTGEEKSQVNAGEMPCHEMCRNFFSDADIPGEMATKMKDFCKGMPDPETMGKMMKMCFEGSKKTESKG